MANIGPRRHSVLKGDREQEVSENRCGHDSIGIVTRLKGRHMQSFPTHMSVRQQRRSQRFLTLTHRNQTTRDRREYEILKKWQIKTNDYVGFLSSPLTDAFPCYPPSKSSFIIVHFYVRGVDKNREIGRQGRVNKKHFSVF
ncbi:hypothetical protein JZ751_007997 [Albula glossodonta]|uniref:Uncharacterized protein n=1 Tax=Albula glossodonta TaxID=121402 RepID=A0A8T2P188_9TELE|nr:hypothetical protein JZ751_007997 [Albula glossodonta]